MEKWINEAFARACEKMESGAKRAAEQGIIPYMGQKDGYSPAPYDGNSWWTGGFWPGMMWQLYAATGRDVYKDEALLTAELRSFMLLNHDVGFMYLLSAGAHGRLIGDAQAYADTLHAATLLAGRFNPTGFIRAWSQADRAMRPVRAGAAGRRGRCMALRSAGSTRATGNTSTWRENARSTSLPTSARTARSASSWARTAPAR